MIDTFFRGWRALLSCGLDSQHDTPASKAGFAARSTAGRLGLAALTGLLAVAVTSYDAASQTRSDDSYRPPAGQDYGAPPSGGYPPPTSSGPTYGGQSYGGQSYGGRDRAEEPPPARGYGQPYSSPPPADNPPPPRYANEGPTRGYYEQGEIVEKGRGFFGSISQGLASAIEHTYRKAGRPNGYVLGEDTGGAFFAGLRYGEGVLYTKDAGDHKVFWQGPSFGYDVGGEGSKVMVLVYSLSDPSEIYQRFGGVEGSAYLVGGVSVQFQKSDDVTLAVIRSGVGLRLGANVGYTKYTRQPTWNPF